MGGRVHVLGAGSKQKLINGQKSHAIIFHQSCEWSLKVHLPPSKSRNVLKPWLHPHEPQSKEHD